QSLPPPVYRGFTAPERCAETTMRTRKRPDDSNLLPAYTPDSILTDKELAKYLRMKPHTLRVWRFTHRNGLPFIRVGRSIRYRFATRTDTRRKHRGSEDERRRENRRDALHAGVVGTRGVPAARQESRRLRPLHGRFGRHSILHR